MADRDETPISTDELRGRLRAHGVTFSDSQFKRLRRTGLLVAGGQEHRRGRRGSATMYPAWAVEQLLLVARLTAVERRFAQLCVAVRWEGGWVRPNALRAALVRLLDAVSQHATTAVAGAVDDDERADRLAMAIAGRGTSGLSRLVRERLAGVNEGVERAAFACAALTAATPPDWSNHDPADPTPSLMVVFETASGIDRARKDDLAGTGPLLRNDLPTEQHLRELQQGGLFNLFDLGAAFISASDAAIEQAFKDAIAVVGLSGAFDAIQHFAGRDAGGLASVSELGAIDDALGRAGLVRTMLLMQPLIPDGALEEIVAAADESSPALREAADLAQALPHLAQYLGAAGAKRLAEVPDDERERIAAEVRAYLAERGEL
jgi:hypothetical protein